MLLILAKYFVAFGDKLESKSWLFYTMKIIQDPILIAFIIIIVLIIFLVLYLVRYSRKINGAFEKLQVEIKFSLQPKFIELSLGVNDLVDLAVEIWRMDQRISESASSLPENHSKGLANSIERLKRYIKKYDIELVDYTNQKYNEGLNLDVLSVEKDTSLSNPIVKKTIEPTVICKGQVVRKAKIILLTNN